MQDSPESKAIRQRMEEVRCELDDDVQAIVESARDVSEWRSYVRDYPWICLGAAAAVGYLIVPRRVMGMRPDAQTLAELANQSHLLATSHSPRKRNLGGVLLAFAGNLALRGVSAYVLQLTGKLLASPTVTSPPDGQP